MLNKQENKKKKQMSNLLKYIHLREPLYTHENNAAADNILQSSTATLPLTLSAQDVNTSITSLWFIYSYFKLKSIYNFISCLGLDRAEIVPFFF